MELLIENNVKSTNLKTFINRNKRFDLNYDKCHKWLEEQESKNAEKARKESIKHQAGQFNMSVKQYQKLYTKAWHILDAFHTGHSMGCYRKLFINGKLFCSNHDLQEYSRSCKWNETYGDIRIDLNKKQLENIEKNNNYQWVVDGKILKEKGLKQFHTIYFEKA
jgi:regulator of replication initiation timing